MARPTHVYIFPTAPIGTAYTVIFTHMVLAAPHRCLHLSHMASERLMLEFWLWKVSGLLAAGLARDHQLARLAVSVTGGKVCLDWSY